MLLHLENFELRNRSKIQIPIGNAKKDNNAIDSNETAI